MSIKNIYKITIIILLFFLVTGALAADSFFKEPDGERGFFGEWITPPKSPSRSGIEEDGSDNKSPQQKENAAKEEYYKWTLSLGGQTPTFGPMGGGGAGFIALGAQWSPLKHIGLGLWVGVPPVSPHVNVHGNNDNPGSYEYFQEYFTVADNDGDPYKFYMLGYGDFSLFCFELESFYFLSDRGLKGLYGGLEAGMVMNVSDIEAYSDEKHEDPIMHIEDNSTSNTMVLPTFDPFYFQGGPIIGYKLIFWGGISLDINAGYTFSNNPRFSGIRLNIKAGYSFKEKR